MYGLGSSSCAWSSEASAISIPQLRGLRFKALGCKAFGLERSGFKLLAFKNLGYLRGFARTLLHPAAEISYIGFEDLGWRATGITLLLVLWCRSRCCLIKVAATLVLVLLITLRTQALNHTPCTLVH